MKLKLALCAALCAALLVFSTACSPASSLVSDLDRAVSVIDSVVPLAEATGLVPLPVQAGLNIALPVFADVVADLSSDLKSGQPTAAQLQAAIAQLNQIMQQLPSTTGLTPADAAKINAVAQIAQLLIDDLEPAAISTVTAFKIQLPPLPHSDKAKLAKIHKKAQAIKAELTAKK